MAEKEGEKSVIKNNVSFVGLDELTPGQQEKVKQIIYEHFVELEREIKHIRGLKVTFKAHNKKEGNPRKKYSVTLFLDTLTKPITVNHIYREAQWDPVTCTHLAIDKAREEIMHKFKTNTDYRKPYQKGVL
jgi:hypothetical protein